MPTASQWQQRIVIELNSDPTLQANIAVLWDAHTRWSTRPYTRYLYTKLDSIDFLLGRLDEVIAPPIEGDYSVRYTGRRYILESMRTAIQARLDKTVRTGGHGAMGRLTTEVITPGPTANGAYPENPDYTGGLVWPYKPVVP